MVHYDVKVKFIPCLKDLSDWTFKLSPVHQKKWVLALIRENMNMNVIKTVFLFIACGHNYANACIIHGYPKAKLLRAYLELFVGLDIVLSLSSVKKMSSRPSQQQTRDNMCNAVT